MLPCVWSSRARPLMWLMPRNTIEIRMAIIAIAVRSSTRVNPRRRWIVVPVTGVLLVPPVHCSRCPARTKTELLFKTPRGLISTPLSTSPYGFVAVLVVVAGEVLSVGAGGKEKPIVVRRHADLSVHRGHEDDRGAPGVANQGFVVNGERQVAEGLGGELGPGAQ